MDSLKVYSLEIKAEKSLGEVTIKWVGRSESPSPSDFLVPYFESILPELEGCKLTVDFKELAYMNSSSVSSIIKLVKMVYTAGIETRLVYNGNSPWQTTSFKALQTICIPMKTVKVEAE